MLICVLDACLMCLDALILFACRREKGKRIINVLITKRCSIIAPKPNDNYFVHPNGAPFAIFNYYFLVL